MGRGYIQITGRHNYAKYGPMIGVPDATENPEKLEEPQNAAKVALAYWKNRVNRAAAKKGLDGMRTVTRNINGGLNGLDDRISKFNKYSKMPLGGGQGALLTSQNPVPKPGDGTFEGQIKKTHNQRKGSQWFKWKQDSTGRWSWWSQKSTDAVSAAKKDYAKQQLAPAAPNPPQPVATPAAVTSAGQTTASDHLKKGDMVSGFELVSPYGPRIMDHSNFHAGIDIGTPVGTYVAFTEDAEILYTGLYSGYGNLIDVWLPAARIQLRLAHLSVILVNKGAKVPARTPVGRTGGAKGHPGSGTSTGPHLHFEADSKKGRAGNRGNGYGGEFDPSPYVKYLILSKTGGSQVAPSGETTSISSHSPETGPGVQGVHPSQQQSRTATAAAQVQPGSPQARQSASAVSSQASYDAYTGELVIPFPMGNRGPSTPRIISKGGGINLGSSSRGAIDTMQKERLLAALY
jgi:murein DD-endopeptidase MepM/ murein hydrolase activator NlpD